MMNTASSRNQTQQSPHPGSKRRHNKYSHNLKSSQLWCATRLEITPKNAQSGDEGIHSHVIAHAVMYKQQQISKFRCTIGFPKCCHVYTPSASHVHETLEYTPKQDIYRALASFSLSSEIGLDRHMDPGHRATERDHILTDLRTPSPSASRHTFRAPL